ncbi:MAG: hypothetical protein V4641_05460 [Pseudomonadota bacterium]
MTMNPNAPRRGQPFTRQHSVKVLEHGIQRAVFAWRELFMAQQPVLELLHAIPNGAGLRHTVKRKFDGTKTRFSKEGYKLKKEGMTAGIPDCCLPAPRGPYHGLYIEHKSATGTVSREQKRKITLLLAEGYHVVVSRDAITTINLILAYLALGPFDARQPGLEQPVLVRKRRRAPLPG